MNICKSIGKFAVFAVSIITSFVIVLPSFGQDNAKDASRQVIENQLSAFQRKDHEEAFTYASSDIHKIIPDVERFIAMVRKGYEPIYSAKSWKFGRAKIDQKNVHHEVLVLGPNGHNWVALYTMVKQADGSWRVSGVFLKKSGATST